MSRTVYLPVNVETGFGQGALSLDEIEARASEQAWYRSIWHSQLAYGRPRLNTLVNEVRLFLIDYAVPYLRGSQDRFASRREWIDSQSYAAELATWVALVLSGNDATVDDADADLPAIERWTSVLRAHIRSGLEALRREGARPVSPTTVSGAGAAGTAATAAGGIGALLGLALAGWGVMRREPATVVGGMLVFGLSATTAAIASGSGGASVTSIVRKALP